MRFLTELEFFIKELRAYWFETVSSLVAYIVMVAGVYWFAIDDEGADHALYLQGYMLWMLSSGLFSAFIMNVKSDISNKTLELMETMPSSYLYSLVIKSLARVPYDLLVMTIAYVVISSVLVDSIGDIALYVEILVNFIIFTPVIFSFAVLCSGVVLAFKRAEVFILLGNVLLGSALYFVVNSSKGSGILELNLNAFYYLLVVIPMVIGNLVIFNALKQWIVKTGRLTEV